MREGKDAIIGLQELAFLSEDGASSPLIPLSSPELPPTDFNCLARLILLLMTDRREFSDEDADDDWLVDTPATPLLADAEKDSGKTFFSVVSPSKMEDLFFVPKTEAECEIKTSTLMKPVPFR